jgi:hypothetical protein
MNPEDVIIDGIYAVNNLAFEGQLQIYKVLEINIAERFGKNNAIIKAERLALNMEKCEYCLVEKETFWLNNSGVSILGAKLNYNKSK